MRFHFGHRRCHEPSEMGRGGPDHRGFGGSKPRMFEQGDLRLVILRLLGDKPAHGYELIKAIEERFGGTYAPSPGIIYPTLTLLEELGQIAVVQSDGARKLFDLTEAGRALLGESQPTVDRVFQRMNDMRARMGGDASPKIRRAMENMKTALRLRLGRGPVSEADVERIADALDAAAKAIEA